MWATDTNPVSRTVSEILTLKYLGVMSLTVWSRSHDVIGNVSIRFAIGHFLFASSGGFSVRRTILAPIHKLQTTDGTQHCSIRAKVSGPDA